jgi:hypothetical protein
MSSQERKVENTRPETSSFVAEDVTKSSGKWTPIPWTVEKWADKRDDKGISIRAVGGVHIANMVTQLDDKEAANARFIVRAVNCHEELLEAVRPFANYACELREGETCDCHNCAARAAIKKAGG